MRQVPPTIFPTDARALRRAVLSSGPSAADASAAAVGALAAHFGRPVVALLDSGTSALTLAISLARARRGGASVGPLVAVPAYGCIDVPTAVMGAGARAIGYDLDPATLAPDEASLRAALAAGASVVVVSHLFGHPVALAPWRMECERHGAVLVEDAAQWAGARLHDAPLCRAGHFAILSLGRGKGLVGTGGGVLLGGETLDVAPPSMHALEASGRLGHLLRGHAALLLGRPALYGMPAAIPALHLGEMVFHAPHPTGPMPLVSARLLPDGLARAASARTERERVARRYVAAFGGGGATAPRAGLRGVGTLPIVPEGATPGVLRQPLLLHAERALPRALGVVRPYPRPLAEQHEVASIVRAGGAMPGATTLAARLVTLPVHARVGEHDIARLCAWLASTTS